MWFRLNRQGEPLEFGTWDNEQGTIFGPPIPRTDGIAIPSFSVRSRGDWRAIIKGIEVYRDEMPVDFDRL
jgi:hypothetical protein